MKLKTILLSLATICLLSLNLNAQGNDKPKEDGFKFQVVKELPITSIKNQNRSSTCWSFSGISFLESEALRKGYKGDLDLSEMFIVSNAYVDKAEKTVRLSGSLNFAPGSSFGDVVEVIKRYGIVPDSEMPGLNYGEDMHVHNELDAVTKAYVDAVVRARGKKTTAWKSGFQGIVDAYLGKVPDKFKVNGKDYTAKSYAESLGLNMDDYVSITSFTHHPFYSQFVIEVPDNWRWDISHNVPLDEMIQIIDNAINNGYTLAWASDVSERGWTRNGVAFVPVDINIEDMSGSDQARWLGLTPAQRDAEALNKPGKEKVITQELRQMEYDNQLTTDDHGMHIFGIAKDQNGTKYYMVKNSWGTANPYNGIWYVSEAFVKYKTLNIMLHKDAIPSNIKQKLNIR